jgi:hypothetical protein
MEFNIFREVATEESFSAAPMIFFFPIHKAVEAEIELV